MEYTIRKFLEFINNKQPGDLKLPDKLVGDFIDHSTIEIDEATKEDDVMDLRSTLGSIYKEHYPKLKGFVELDFYVWADSRQGLIKQGESIAKQLRDKYDNKALVKKVCVYIDSETKQIYPK